MPGTLKIKTNGGFLPEKKYIADVILSEFLGLDYIISGSGAAKDYEITGAGKKIVIKDCFFKFFSEPDGYLSKDNIPRSVVSAENEFSGKRKIPAIFGKPYARASENEIVCGIDIFASCFFMLSRWEEHANAARDEHNRFPSKESLAHKNGFLDRPVVNEYAEMLWSMLVIAGIRQKRKKRSFEVIPTHDVDRLLMYRKITSGYWEIAADVLKGKGLDSGLQKTRRRLLIQAGKLKDPFDTFDRIMRTSENAGLKSIFFFKSGGRSAYDAGYKLNSAFALKTIKKITSRGHAVGLHPSYDSYNDPEAFLAEKETLENLLGSRVKCGRQHYLRFESPLTWQIWEDSGMEWDSTLGYPDREGFRCGTCYEYSVFNFITRKKLNLKEYPLLAMDGSFISYQGIGEEDIIHSKLMRILDECRKHNGKLVLLWHNTVFREDFCARAYERIIENC